ncbi:MAG: spermidine synthase, partial [Nitrospiria bacterium]
RICPCLVSILPEPVEEGPAYLLYTKEFYHLVMERLSEYGIISLQAGTTSTSHLLCFSAVYKTLKTVFPIVSPYQTTIPSFGLPWGFALASKHFDPQSLDQKEINRRIAQRVDGELRSFDGETHLGQFMLQKQVRLLMEKHERIIEDNQPLYIYN